MKIALLALIALFPILTMAQAEEYTVTYGDAFVKDVDGIVVVTVKTPKGLRKGTKIQYGIDGSSQSATLTSGHAFRFKTSPGEHTFQFYLPSKTKNYAEISTGSINVRKSEGTATFISLNFRIEEYAPIIVDKPVIYLYPTHATEVDIQLQPKIELAFTYPAYEKGWKGTANPDGSFTANDKNYPYLFWEGKSQNLQQLTDYSIGSIVTGENSVVFLEEQLTKMGLNQREQTDFITFWAPRMVSNSANFVHFVFNEDYNQIAELNIAPKPDQVFRVFMLWTPLKSDTEVPAPKAQEIPALDRTGFCVVEWGGSELPSISSLSLNH